MQRQVVVAVVPEDRSDLFLLLRRQTTAVQCLAPRARQFRDRGDREHPGYLLHCAWPRSANVRAVSATICVTQADTSQTARKTGQWCLDRGAKSGNYWRVASITSST